MSLLIAVSSSAFAYAAVSRYTSGSYLALMNLSESAALYDITGEFMSNSAAQACLSSITSNSACIGAIEQMYGSAYGVRMSISSQGVAVGHADGGRSACFVFGNESACFTAGD